VDARRPIAARALLDKAYLANRLAELSRGESPAAATCSDVPKRLLMLKIALMPRGSAASIQNASGYTSIAADRQSVLSR
jgi:hypothetical protein